MQEELLTIKEVAKKLRCDDATVRRWVVDGALEAIRLPHKGKRNVYRIKKTTLVDILPMAKRPGDSHPHE